jgi:flagellar motor component MotA
MLRFIIGTLAAVATIVLVVIMEGGTISSYLILSALLVGLLVPVFSTLAVWSLREWGGAWKDAFGASKGSPTAAASRALWDFFEKGCYGAGVLGTLAGLILVLSQLSEISKVGPAVALSLTSLLYAILLGLVARILRARVDSRA